MGVAFEGRLTADERRGVAGEGLVFVGVLSSSSEEGMACSFHQSALSAFHG